MKTAVVMPAWNEEEGIGEFLAELERCLRFVGPQFIVVDDKSTDATYSLLENLASSGFPLVVTTNETNLGHGPSTIRALSMGLASRPDVIVAIDGDGQFLGEDVATALRAFGDENIDVLEGVRQARNEPKFRQGVTLSTRLLVWSRTGRMPRDANTPLRIYKPVALQSLLASIPEDLLTPNLAFSVLTRNSNLITREFPVRSIPRRGSNQQGSTWLARTQWWPSRRFLAFCGKALRQWFAVPARHLLES